MLKYEIWQEVWFIEDNVICKGTIRRTQYNGYIDCYDSKEIIKEITYWIRDYKDIYREDEIFESKQALLDHLSKTADEKLTDD